MRRNDMAHAHPGTIAEAFGFGPLLLMVLLLALALAIVALDEPRPALVLRDDVPAARAYCVGGQYITVLEAGKRAGGPPC